MIEKVRYNVEKFSYDNGYRVTKEGKIISPLGNEIGFNKKFGNYVCKIFKIRYDGKSIPVKVARLQAYQKFGEQIYDENILVRHFNNNSLDDSYENILIGTQTDNADDINPNQRILNCLGSSITNKKYSQELIEKIRKLKRSGITLTELSKRFTIPKSTIHHMLNNIYLSEKVDELKTLLKVY